MTRTLKEIAIELLEKYEEAACDFIWQTSPDFEKDQEEIYAECNRYKEEIENCSSHSEWIPVTERLPKETDEYLVCYNNGDVSTDWYGFTDYGLIAGFDEDIIAWMERPKPYKEGKRVIFAKDTNAPTNDCISRQAVIDAIRVYMNGYKEHIGKADDSEVFAHSRGLLLSIESSINALPSAEPLTEEDYTELRDRFGEYVEFVVRDMISRKEERWK